MLQSRNGNAFKRVFFVTRMVNVKKSVEENCTNSDYDTSSTGSIESEVSLQLSTSKASTTETASLKTVNEGITVKTVSKSTRKKFFRHFPNVEETEEVLNRYTCALVGDILLQGHLFITSNYFAFYSNVFGYVTRILIPILSVEKITKEKTAKILPNAIGITTCESTRYVFGSLISRDNTLKYVTKVWEKVKSETPLIVDDELMEEDVFNESEQDESGVDSSYPSNDIQYKGQQNDRQTAPKVIVETKSYFIRIPKIPRIMKLLRPGLVLTATTVLLIILYLTATILLYRINQIEHRYSRALHGLSHADSNIIYPDLLKWQAELHSKTNDAVYGYIDSNLVEIAKIRQSLEKLSSLLVNKEDPLKASFPERNIS